MTRIAIEPSPPELGLHAEAYDALAVALRAQGHDVEVRGQDGGIERRDLPGPIVGDVLVYLRDNLAAEALGALVALIGQLVREHLRAKRRARRTAVIYGPQGDVLQTVEIPASDDG